MDENAMFCRLILADVNSQVRRAVPGVRLRDAWVYKLDRDQWEFHYKDFYWYGDADNAFDARAKGWESYLRMRPCAKCGQPDHKAADCEAIRTNAEKMWNAAAPATEVK